jgi:hypothetical protein
MKRAWWITKIIFLGMVLLMAGFDLKLPSSYADGGKCKGGACVKTGDGSCYCNGDFCVGCYKPNGSPIESCGSCVGKGGDDEFEIESGGDS